MKFSYQKGFTLIELLVVISIIGVLSSVVLASVSTARDKGRVAAGQLFASHNLSLLGGSAFGYYDFNDNSGGPVDFSQYKRNGVLRNGATYIDITPNKSPFALSLDGTNDSVDISGGASYTSPTSFTLMTWVYPTGAMNSYVNSSLMSFGASGDVFQLKNGGLNYYAASLGNISTAVGIVKSNVWTHVALVVESDILKFYVNGREVPISLGAYAPGYQQPPLLEIGSRLNDNAYVYKGYLDDVAVLPTALTFTQLQEIYAQGLPTHSLAKAK